MKRYEVLRKVFGPYWIPVEGKKAGMRVEKKILLPGDKFQTEDNPPRQLRGFVSAMLAAKKIREIEMPKKKVANKILTPEEEAAKKAAARKKRVAAKKAEVEAEKKKKAAAGKVKK